MTEEQLGLIAQGTTRWIERWYGSEPMKGSSIITVNHDEIAVIGGDKETHRQVRKVVMAHNAALEALDTERTRADKAEQRERELREALAKRGNGSDWFAGDVDADGNVLVTVRWDELVEQVRHSRICNSDDGCECGAVAFLDKHAPIQPEPDPLVERRADTSGYIVGNGDRTKWRAWQNGWSTWVDDPAEATRYHFRTDAMAVHQEDEDAWCIVPFAEVSIVKGES